MLFRSQAVSGSDIATAWTYNTTENANGVHIDGTYPSRIVFEHAGTYRIAYSGQIEKIQGGTSTNVTIFAKLNGNNVDRSSSTVTLVANSAYQLPYVAYIFTVNANDYVEFFFTAPSQYVQITNTPSNASPAGPSVIIDVEQITYTQLGPQGVQGTQGSQGPTGPQGAQGNQGLIEIGRAHV